MLKCTESSIESSLLCCCLNLEISKSPKYNFSLIENAFIPLLHNATNHSHPSLVGLQSEPHQARPPPSHSQALPHSSTSVSHQTGANPRAKDGGLPVPLAVDYARLEELPRDPMFGTKRALRLICVVSLGPAITQLTYSIILLPLGAWLSLTLLWSL